MCDTICAPGPQGMVFAKNSDRPPGEVQVAWPFGRRASAGGTLRTQYLTIGDTGAHATFLSCPTWLWGAEHGVNEYGVAIGNERVSTTHDAQAAKPALIGMDLVRLGLERARTASEAVEVMTGLLGTCGQGGIADAARQEAYDSSFLIADPTEAFVLETAGSDFAVARFPAGVAISNRLRLGTEWTRASAGLAGGRLRPVPRRGEGNRLRRRPPGGQPPFPRLERFRRPHSGGHRGASARSRDGPLGRARHRGSRAPAAVPGRRGLQRRHRLHARP